MLTRFALITAALAAFAIPAVAQEEKPVDFNLGGGFTAPYSDARDAFGGGAFFQIGATVNLKPTVGIQANYGYTRFGSKDIAPTGTTLPASGNIITTIPLTANHSMHDGDFSLVFSGSKQDHTAVPYGLAGLGVYHDIVNVTTPSVGLATVCDPWLLICYPAAVPVDRIIGERTNTAFGLQFGGGVSFRVNDTGSFYVEIRYIHTYGPSFTNGAGVTTNANGNYFPFIFGFKM
jgi:opacity protein-like surface antigen